MVPVEGKDEILSSLPLKNLKQIPYGNIKPLYIFNNKQRSKLDNLINGTIISKLTCIALEVLCELRGVKIYWNALAVLNIEPLLLNNLLPNTYNTQLNATEIMDG